MRELPICRGTPVVINYGIIRGELERVLGWRGPEPYLPRRHSNPQPGGSFRRRRFRLESGRQVASRAGLLKFLAGSTVALI